MTKNVIIIEEAKTVINAVTALCFLAFSLYHTYLLVYIASNRLGRALGIASFVALFLAAAFALIPMPFFRSFRKGLLIGGLALNFFIKLFNAPVFFSMLNFASMPSVLNWAIYVFAQTAELLMLVYYIFFRYNTKLKSKQVLGIILMSFAILLYVACLLMECVMLLQYHLNIDLSLTTTFLSRFLYFFGFAGTALNLMLLVPQTVSPKDVKVPVPDGGDFKFGAPEKTAVPSAQPRQPMPIGDDLVFSSQKNDRKPHAERPHQPMPIGDDLVFSSQKNDRKPHAARPHQPMPVGDDLVFSSHQSSAKLKKKKKKQQQQIHLSEDYDDLVL